MNGATICQDYLQILACKEILVEFQTIIVQMAQLQDQSSLIIKNFSATSKRVDELRNRVHTMKLLLTNLSQDLTSLEPKMDLGDN